MFRAPPGAARGRKERLMKKLLLSLTLSASLLLTPVLAAAAGLTPAG